MGRVLGHRGLGGEITVKVVSGEAGLWQGLEQIEIAEDAEDAEDGEGAERTFGVEASRSYKDRLVLKLAGIDDANAAARLRGKRVLVSRTAAPELGEDRYFAADLVGFEAVDESGVILGRVIDVLPTGGTDILVVESDTEREELLIPMAQEIVLNIDASAGRILLRPPEGLLEINRVPGERQR